LNRYYEAERSDEKYIELVKKGPNVEIIQTVPEKIEEKGAVPKSRARHGS
jgi:hypothetical protein